jgi:hypothetical protein
MNKKLSKQTKSALVEARKVIREHSKEQESEYQLILKELKIEDDTDASLWVHDYLYNNCLNLSELEKKLMEKENLL